jgi:hypothetical protein
LPRANVLLFMDRFRNIVFKEPTFDQHVCLWYFANSQLQITTPSLRAPLNLDRDDRQCWRSKYFVKYSGVGTQTYNVVGSGLRRGPLEQLAGTPTYRGGGGWRRHWNV